MKFEVNHNPLCKAIWDTQNNKTFYVGLSPAYVYGSLLHLT